MKKKAVGALVVLLLAVIAAVASAGSAGATGKITITSSVDCGKVTLKVQNSTRHTFSGDWRFPGESGSPDLWTTWDNPKNDEVGLIPGGPHKGKPFGNRYHHFEILPGPSTQMIELGEDSPINRVDYRVWRGPENDYFVDWQTSEPAATNCKPNVTVKTKTDCGRVKLKFVNDHPQLTGKAWYRVGRNDEEVKVAVPPAGRVVPLTFGEDQSKGKVKVFYWESRKADPRVVEVLTDCRPPTSTTVPPTSTTTIPPTSSSGTTVPPTSSQPSTSSSRPSTGSSTATSTSDTSTPIRNVRNEDDDDGLAYTGAGGLEPLLWAGGGFLLVGIVLFVVLRLRSRGEHGGQSGAHRS